MNQRKQFVEIPGQRSSTLTILVGAPQGSCLSPLFFIILIADINEWTTCAIIAGFADDISATVVEKDLSKVLPSLEKDATNILKFMASNELIANDSKTAFILFGKRQEDKTPIKLNIGNAEIMEQTSLKLLGLTFSNDLKWNEHTEHTLNTLNHRLYLFKHARSKLPDSIIPSVANALITSHIRYALPILVTPRLSDQDPRSSISNSLQVAQNHMTRSWIQVKKIDKVNMKSARSSLGILSVNQLAIHSIITETRKILIDNTIPWIKNILTERGTTKMNTRAATSNKIRSQPSKTEKNLKGFIHQAFKLWNALPKELRDLSQPSQAFNQKVKKWLLSSDIP